MKILLLTVVSLFNFVAFSQDCSDLKNGKWVVISENNEELTTYITREGDFQIEETPTSGITLKSNIKWTSKCTYTLENSKVLKNESGTRLPKSMLEMTLIFTIIEQTDKFYSAKCTMKGNDEFETEIKYKKIQ